MKLFTDFEQADNLYYFLCVVIVLTVFLIGVTIFSFCNVLIANLPKKKHLSKRSECPFCGHQLKINEALPVVSFILNRGKCPYCFERIPFRNVIIELFGGIISVLCVIGYGVSLKALLMFIFYGILTVIAFIDMDTLEIPFVLNVSIFILGIMAIFIFPETGILSRVIGFFCVSVFLFVVVLFVPEGFGGGDIKLVASAGFLLGYKAMIVGFFVSLLLGGGYGAYLMIVKNVEKKAHFAFGPFLCIGIGISSFIGWGEYIMNIYLNFIK